MTSENAIPNGASHYTPERQRYKELVELQNVKIAALKVEVNALKSLVANQQPMDPAAAEDRPELICLLISTTRRTVGSTASFSMHFPSTGSSLPFSIIPSYPKHKSLTFVQYLCHRVLEFGLETDHQGRYATFFQRHGPFRAAIMARSSLNQAWDCT